MEPYSKQTINGKEIWRFQRMIASPGKHGPHDWVVEFQAAPDSGLVRPTSAEFTAAVGVVSLAQRKTFGDSLDLGIGGHVLEVVECETMREIFLRAGICQLEWDKERLRRDVRRG